MFLLTATVLGRVPLGINSEARSVHHARRLARRMRSHPSVFLRGLQHVRAADGVGTLPCNVRHLKRGQRHGDCSGAGVRETGE